MSAPPRCTHACTSPTGIKVSLNSSKCVLSPKQAKVITDVLAESSELLGSDAAYLPMPDSDAAKLSLPPGVTYQQALETITTPKQARDFTKAVLLLREDPRVQGEELELG